MLRIGIRQEQAIDGDRLSRWDELRIALNLALKPNIWTPLAPADEYAMWMKRPDLRRELLTLA